MQNSMTLQEMLDSIRTLFAQDMTRRPAHRNKPVADPGPLAGDPQPGKA